MRLRTFTAPNMPAAMKMVREEMGDNAIIVASEPLGLKRSVSVTAAVEAHANDDHHSRENDSTLDELRFEMQNILRFHNLPELFLAKIMQKATDTELNASIALHKLSGQRDVRRLHRLALETLLANFFAYQPIAFARSTRIMLVGSPGIGKTLTAAKIAARLAMDKEPFAVITTDNKRAGGIEQLQAFTDILGVELLVAASLEELQGQLQEIPAQTRVIIDTAGCNPYESSEIKELKSYATIEGVEPILVMSAGGDSLEAIDAIETFEAMPIRRLLITRADATRRFGNVLSVAAAHRLAFCNVSNSSSVTDALQPADPAMLTQCLLRYQLQS